MTAKDKRIFSEVESLMDKAEHGSYAAKVELNRIINQYGSEYIGSLYDTAIAEYQQ